MLQLDPRQPEQLACDYHPPEVLVSLPGWGLDFQRLVINSRESSAQPTPWRWAAQGGRCLRLALSQLVPCTWEHFKGGGCTHKSL